VFASAAAVLALASPQVDAQVVDREGRVAGPKQVSVPAFSVRSEGRTCRLRAGLPLGVLRALRVPFKVEGSCSSLYVFEARRQRERGAGGWVYKVGRKLPGVSASSPASRLRAGQRVTWFWCVQAGKCQRSLETRSAAEGGTLRVTVTAYDDKGSGVPAAGAQVSAVTGGERRSGVTAADGTATLPVQAGPITVTATRRGLVPSFPERVAAR
jgi:hypothetical protein